MRIDSAVFPQSLVESSKPLGKKDVTSNDIRDNRAAEESQTLTVSSFGAGGTYSINSLKAAVDYHVKYLSVAENNMKAIQHPPTVPKGLIDYVNGLQTEGISQ